MGSTAPEQKGTMRQGPGAKRLEGVKATDDLRRLIRDVRSMGTNHAAATSTWESLDESIPSLSSTEAALNLRNFDTSNPFIPFAVLRAVDLLTANDPQHKQRLEACLRSTQLAFTPPPPRGSETEERKKFRRRIEMLKLKQEENRYGGLVKNVGLHAPNDDVTTRSMTYAASIGLNMIVAPLSFGCLMYFFAGGLFNYMGWDENRPAYMGPDIRKVIAGVVSGVLMLMIEMILFVIRSHEMDKAMRTKAKTQKSGAFGYYTSNTQRHFKGE